ncbi:putative toxin-antitoxin system toxin component, PIN family [Dyadobacter sp. 3J3]|uniref:putative toxin-antitoxin system toxin component, PIN family n=1 Tax=Dyadobacter sp. 3J3 TaxID=2606600 RepID=UPI00286D82D7|nr:putative toxin-antitoxin system toxin component, PIN family [Dyadobacter sp. 3J3]
MEICRDPKDNFLLSLSIDGNAHFLLTGDKNLLELNPFQNTSIIAISDFLQIN